MELGVVELVLGGVVVAVLVKVVIVVVWLVV